MLQNSWRSTVVGIASLSALVLVASVLPAPAFAGSDPTGQASRAPNPPSNEAVYESEFCEVLHRFNASKKISDPDIRGRVEGEYNQADDVKRLRTWNVETTCGEFLVVVPMWADVSPPVLAHKGGDLFEDATGATWEFQSGSDGGVTGVTVVWADGTASEMTRFGDSRQWGDPHEKLNGKHIKDWKGKQR